MLVPSQRQLVARMSDAGRRSSVNRDTNIYTKQCGRYFTMRRRYADL